MSDDGVTRRQVLASGGVAAFIIGFLSANSDSETFIAPPSGTVQTIDSDNFNMEILIAETLDQAEAQRTEEQALLLADNGVEVVY